jgi:hypothetical protein
MAIDGTYNITIDSPMGKQNSKLTLKTEGDKLSGTQVSPMGKGEFTDGKINGNDLEWVISAMGMKFTYTATVVGDEISGQMKAGFMKASFKGTRE